MAPWKIFQVPKHERSRESLPKPPAGMAWLQDPKTRDWKLVPEEDVVAETTTALANSEITETTKNGHGVCGGQGTYGVSIFFKKRI